MAELILTILAETPPRTADWHLDEPDRPDAAWAYLMRFPIDANIRRP